MGESGPPYRAGWLREELDAAAVEVATWPEGVAGPVAGHADQVILDGIRLLETRAELLRAEAARRGLVR